MLRAIIIDDEQKGINSIKLLIEKFITDVKVVAESTDAVKGLDLIEDYKPEIVFLDIKMPHLNGFELLQQLKFRQFSLIFTTAHEEFAIKAIKNNALDYLLKPIDIEDLEKAINKAKVKHANKAEPLDLKNLISELNMHNANKIPFNVKDSVEYINKNEIIRLESDSNYTYVHFINGRRLTIAKTIGEFEPLLCYNESNFMRVHQSHIVNLNHVIKYLKDNGGIIITKDNCEVPLSKNKRDDFIRWLNIK